MIREISYSDVLRVLLQPLAHIATRTCRSLLIALACLSTSSQGHAAATFTPLGLFRGLGSEARDVSADGEVVVGVASTIGGQDLFHWAGGQSIVRSGSYDHPAVSANGSVVVGSHFFPPLQAFHWTVGGDFEALGGFPGMPVRSEALDVSADGSVVVGYGTAADGPKAFRWTAPTGMVSLGALDGGDSHANGVSANGAVVVGQNLDARAGAQAFRWTAETGIVGLGRAPGAIESLAHGVSADGSVVVGVNRFPAGPPGSSEAFLWTERDGMVGLGDFPGGPMLSEAYDVSADGSVIVGSGWRDGGPEAFYWTAQTGMLHLRELLISQGVNNLDGWRLPEGRAVSSDGLTIVGRAFRDGRSEAFVATIPEPSTWILAALGTLILFALYLRHSLAGCHAERYASRNCLQTLAEVPGRSMVAD